MQRTINNPRKKIYSIAMMMLACMASCLTGCSSDDENFAGADNHNVNVDFAFSLNSTSTRFTRMSANVTQTDGTSFRGLSELHLYPFALQRKIVGSDVPTPGEIHSVGAVTDASANNSRYFFYNNQNLELGTGAFLAYARANRASLGSTATDADYMTTYGMLNHTTFSQGISPQDISFSLQQIYSSTDAPAEATKLAAYLTYIASATNWNTTTQSQLRALYLNFINMTNTAEADIFAGSSTNVLLHVQSLYDNVNGLSTSEWTVEEKAIRTEILSRITNPETASKPTTFVPDDGTSKPTSLGNYPNNIGLPDGAAILRWTGSAFEPQTTTTTLAAINAISRYAYPAELWYYANTQIDTSNSTQSAHYPATSTETWTQVLNQYSNKNDRITLRTRSVALVEPLQYAVAHLKVILKQLTTSTLADADNKAVTIGAGEFPLTGVIVGGQRPVDFEFMPEASDVNMRLVYDRSIPSGIAMSSTADSEANHTLLLQNQDDEEVTIILEFQNNSSTTFRGINGIVRPGTHFYLIGRIAPDAAPNPDTRLDKEKRVFTQDHTTTIQMTISSLANAYNVLPDILLPRLEIGVELMPWVETTPSNVQLN